MTEKSYTIKSVSGLKPSLRRAVVFLLCPGDDEIDAHLVFDALDPKTKYKVMTRLDHWIGFGKQDRWFHGWPNHPKYKECFVFKWNKGPRLHHRLYGFLCHPKPAAEPNFQICVLCSYATKHALHTDPSELERERALKLNPGVIAAIQFAYPDSKKGVRIWTN